MKNKLSVASGLVCGALLCWCMPVSAGNIVIQDNFTGASSTNAWLLPVAGDGTANTACMTAGDGTGSIPACTTFTGGRSADTAGNGALRLTDTVNNEHGAIVSNFTFPSSSGIQVTFTTYTYGGTGADGINFFLADGSASPTIGGTGGSLGYTCSNVNSGFNGVIGGYIGLGIDEFGNYLNPGDNTVTGPGFQAGRIGLRGSGNVNWTWLSANYPSLYPPSITSLSTQQTAVQTTCKKGLLQQGTPSSFTWTWTSTTTSDDSVLKSNCSSILTYSALTGYNSTNYPNSTKLKSSDKTNAVNQTCSTNYIQIGTYSGSKWTWTSTNTALPSYLLTNACNSLKYSALQSASPSGYPSSVTSTSDQKNAVDQTCSTGYLQTGTSAPAAGASWTWSTASPNISIADYPLFTDSNGNYIGYSILPSTTPIGSSAKTRANAKPISYKLQITGDGYLSLWYSYNNGTYQSVLTNQSIVAQSGALPANLRFGFTGSTGGSNNVHEITCFQAIPSDVSSSSAGLNVQSGQLRTGSQAYSAFYNARNWSGSLVAYDLLEDPTTQTVSVSSTANWDGSCVLTGGTCSTTGATGMTAQGSASRTILSWNGSQGVPFEWATTPDTGTLTAAQQNALNAVDQYGSDRLAYLRGDRSLEVSQLNSNGSYTANTNGEFRTRTSVLADITDSSPTWVGPPEVTSYTLPWQDKLYPTQSLAEVATGAQSYASYASTYAGRLNLVYVGANDGLLHAFRAGSYDAAGHYINNATTPNDGREMLAYMPGAIVNTIHNGSNTGLDFSSPQYGHNYFVDAAPGTGDLFFKNAWHTWLISGLGPGGSAIYALDITDPSNFSESNASSIVIGEWDNTTLTNLGQTYGTPVITRFHNGQWGAVFGNGLNSANGAAGIYIMLVDPTSGAISFKFLTTGPGSSSNPNGIAFATPADLDYDNITDYVYAGDMYGQVWRFDLTSSNPSNWGVKTSAGTVATSTNPGVPMFKTNSGQPISTKVMVAAVAPSSATALSRIMVMFGTGTKVPQSLTSPAIYATGTQDIYDVWDWDMSTWNSLSTTDYAALGSTNAPTAVLGKTNLTQQSIIQTFNFTDQIATLPSRTITSNAVCWQGSTVCSGGTAGNNKFGSYLDLPSTTTAGGTTVYEQAIYSPAILAGAFVINTAVPETNSPFTCTASSAQSWTYGLSVANGGATSVSYFGLSANGTPVSAISFGGVGTSSLVNGDILITQTSIGGGGSGTGGSGSGGGGGSLPGGGGGGGGSGLNVQKVTPVPGTGARINWAQLR